ncbi:unnamed protein product, partial [Polarella glacialis]
ASAAAYSNDASDYKRSSGARIRTSGTKLPKNNSIHHATIVCVKEFGGFVQLGKGDVYKDGFLHVSMLPAPPGVERVEIPDTIIKEGDKCWVKARDVDEQTGKYAVDMRYVHQITGKDLDPYQGKGRLPDTEWKFPGQLKNLVKALATPDEDAPAFAAPKRKFAVGSESDSSDGEALPDTEEGRKMKKKLEKQKKKLDKMRNKAEKAKQKIEKKGDKKKSKKKKKEESSSSSSGS